MKKRAKVTLLIVLVAIVAVAGLIARALHIYYHKNDEPIAAYDQAIGDCVNDRTRAVGSSGERDAASSDCVHESLDGENK